jgi:hypothetical protein
MKKVFLIICYLCFTFLSNAQQQENDIIKQLNKDWLAQIKFDNGYMNINIALQMWNVESLKYPQGDFTPRYDMFIRRGRFGVNGKIASKLTYSTMFSYDGIGKDKYTVSQGGALNSDDNFRFVLRDGFLSYNSSRALNITVGYFRPRLGKEAIYSSWFCISQEKSLPNNQPRMHVLGRAIGRETGINIGGLKTINKSLNLLYDVGLFDTNSPLIIGNDSIKSILKTARIVLMIGEPEMKDYSLVYYQSGYGKRKGISFGINASHQGKTSIFKQNMFYGADIQLNYGALDLVLEQDWMYRESIVTSTQSIKTIDKVNSAKIAWNFVQKNNTIIQPTFMISSETPDEQYSGQNPFTKSSKQYVVDAGINWLINKDRLKLGLHYIQGKIEIDSNKPYSYVNGSIQFML